MTAQPKAALALAAIGALFAALIPATIAGVGPPAGRMILLAAVCGVSMLAVVSDPAWSLAGAVAASMFSGRWAELGLSLPVDRMLLLLTVAALVFRMPLSRPRWPRVRFVHVALLTAALFATASAFSHGLRIEGSGVFALLDRFGLVPFAAFVLAPIVFDTPRRRAILLGTLSVTGAYLGLTALAEALRLTDLIWPRYIADTSVGLHAERARGPFVSGTAMGTGLWGCGVAALVVTASSSRQWRRVAGVAVAALCVVGVFLTLTRTVWLGAIVAAIVTLGLTPGLRRYLVPAAVGAVLLIYGAMLALPDVAEQARSREATQSSVWDRQNSNAAALRMLEARPLVGFGWDRFEEESPPYYRQAFEYPLSEVGQVHNVYLSNLAELGLIGTSLWLIALLVGVGGALLRRPPPGLRPWRAGLVAIATMWLIAAALDPLPYVFPNLLLWTWAGVLWAARPGDPRATSG